MLESELMSIMSIGSGLKLTGSGLVLTGSGQEIDQGPGSEPSENPMVLILDGKSGNRNARKEQSLLFDLIKGN